MPRYDDDARIYRTFEEFEREELRRMDTLGASVDEMLDDVFTGDLDLGPAGATRARDRDEGDDEEE